MKCRVCGEPASISLRSHKTAFCDTHFITFFEKRVHTTVRRYDLIPRDDRPVVAVSGGKDSLSLWLLLTRMGIAADGVYAPIGLPRQLVMPRIQDAVPLSSGFAARPMFLRPLDMAQKQLADHLGCDV